MTTSPIDSRSLEDLVRGWPDEHPECMQRLVFEVPSGGARDEDSPTLEC